MATGHACTKVFARLKAAIPHTSSPCFEAVKRLEDALENASLAQAASKEICRLCQIAPEIDRVAELVVNLEEKMHSLHYRLFQWFALTLGTPYTPYSKNRRVLERECRALMLFLRAACSTDSRSPDIIVNEPTSAMFEGAREFQISGANVASLGGNSNTVNYISVNFAPQNGSPTQQIAM
ncbi:hypothetical protein JOM56_004482 [Amanita muscaria]